METTVIDPNLYGEPPVRVWLISAYSAIKHVQRNGRVSSDYKYHWENACIIARGCGEMFYILYLTNHQKS